ncbi:MAG TPA: TraB/GumN family protein [Candidatus Poseidoniales archaeon]|nr:MAG TPA: TraB/GumN family protein [Candidatus Poseidoniales archaeon]
MTIDSDNIVDFSPNLRLVGTAHVSSKSVEMVRKEISEYEPDIVAVELCKSRLSSLKEPESLDSEDLLKIIKEGKSPMILLQSALAAQQRKMGLTTGEKPGAELLEAVQRAEESNIPVEMIDRDVLVTLRRAWRGMGIIEKWRVITALLLEEEEDEELSIDEILGDSDMLSKMMEDARDVAPGAGEVLIDERDAFLAGRIQQIRGNGKVLAVVGAGHLEGIVNNLNDPPMDINSRLAELSIEPPKKIWPKVIMAAVPLFLFGSIGYMAYNGDMEEIWQTAETWLVLNAVLAGLGILIVRGHPLSIIAGALASPITSLNPTLAAGWFAGYAQIKVDGPTGGDAQEFLVLDDFSLLWRNRVGKVLMVTIMGNMGSSIGAWLAGGAIFMQLFG